MRIMPSGSSTAGAYFTLACSANIIAQPDTPPPHFQWFFGPSNNSLPFRPPRTTDTGSNMYTSTLQFSPLSQSHAGMYTCRLGGNTRLAARTTLIADGIIIYYYCRPGTCCQMFTLIWDCFIVAPPITVKVTSSLNAPLMVGQTGNSLLCNISGADNLNPTIAYQWTRDGVTVQGGSSNILNFSPLRLSLAGVYTCSATVTSNFLNSAIEVSASNNQTVTIEGEFNNVIGSIMVVISYMILLSQQFRIHRQ